MKRNLTLFVLLLLVSLAVSGCGKTLSEKAAEKAIENSLGGNANVDVNNKKVSIETEQGNLEVGEDLSLPSDWPEDIYVPRGRIVSSRVNDQGHSATIASDESVAEVKSEYQSKLVDNGWNITMTFDVGDGVMIGAEKDDRSLSISIASEDNGETSVAIVEGKK